MNADRLSGVAGRLKSTLLGSKPRIAGTAVLGLVVLVGLGFLLGVLGTPTVASVQNQFGDVDDSTTTIHTDLVLSNPNPVGVSLGGATVNYSVLMNDVHMASGQKHGLQIGQGNTTLEFTTSMHNERIPAWWHSHVANGEQTSVLVDARVRSSLLGGQTFELPQKQTIQTNIIGGFNSRETRPVSANQPLISDPVLYINETSAAWNQTGLTRSATPIDMSFTLYNPKSYPITLSQIGYDISMNDVGVGQGGSEDPVAIPPGTAQTVDTQTVINNTRLDEWWVSHLQRNQVTTVTIDFTLAVDPDTAGVLPRDVQTIQLPIRGIDHTQEIETDIFGTKDATAAGGGQSAGSDGQTGGEGSATTATGGDGGIVDGGSTDGGLVSGTTDDGLFGGDSSGDDGSGSAPTPDDSTDGGASGDGTTDDAATTTDGTDGGGLLG